MLRSAHRLDPRDARRRRGCVAEQVGEALLQLQVLLDRHAAGGSCVRAGDLAVLGLEQREEAGLDGQPRELDRVGGRRAPAERAGHEDVDVARAADRHRACVTLYSRSRRLATVAVAT